MAQKRTKDKVVLTHSKTAQINVAKGETKA
jgi:hypothetical protein